jgi:hypothetical protein
MGAQIGELPDSGVHAPNHRWRAELTPSGMGRERGRASAQRVNRGGTAAAIGPRIRTIRRQDTRPDAGRQPPRTVGFGRAGALSLLRCRRTVSAQCRGVRRSWSVLSALMDTGGTSRAETRSTGSTHRELMLTRPFPGPEVLSAGKADRGAIAEFGYSILMVSTNIPHARSRIVTCDAFRGARADHSQI